MTEPDVRLRWLSAGDERVLDDAVWRFRRTTGVDSVGFLADPATLICVAVAGGDIVGWAWGHRQRHVCGHWQIQLYEIEVAEGRRRRGVGRMLLDEFLSVARGTGHAKVWLFTSVDNVAAIALYRAAGGVTSFHDDVGFWWRLRPDSAAPIEPTIDDGE